MKCDDCSEIDAKQYSLAVGVQSPFTKHYLCAKCAGLHEVIGFKLTELPTNPNADVKQAYPNGRYSSAHPQSEWKQEVANDDKAAPVMKGNI